MVALATLRSLIEGLPEPIMLFDSDFQILGVNDAYARTFNEQIDVIVGQKCYQVLHQNNRPCGTVLKPCPLQIAQRTGKRVEEVRNQCGSDGARRVRVELIPIKPDASGKQYFLNRIHQLEATPNFAKNELVGDSTAFQSMMSLVERVARSSTTVLLLGESGTGKELIAQAIHDFSPRQNKSFVAIDCSGLPETLFESELFGHERGAFTGATSARIGLLETANGGTLFIDEVGDIPLGLQIKLLRFLETGTYRRLGSTIIRHADVRIVSATHQPLLDLVKQQLFRQDLYYRLSAFPIHLPNLRARVDDIPILVTTLLQRISQREHQTFSITQQAIVYLKTINLKGNIRELRNVLERAAVLAPTSMIELNDIQFALSLEVAHLDHDASFESTLGADQHKPLSVMEDDLLLSLINTHQGNKKQLAKSLGISERTLYRKLNKLVESLNECNP
jgi:two-component system response regulator HydG